LLRCQGEYLDVNTGLTKISTIRTEIHGIQQIQELCKTNSIKSMIGTNKVKFINKTTLKDEKTNAPYLPIDYNDLNFRVGLNVESSISKNSPVATQIVSSWDETKKNYRFINRVTFDHWDSEKYPFTIDLSIVKQSHRRERGQMIPEYNITDAELFNDIPRYEIEFELHNDNVKKYKLPSETIEAAIKKLVTIILSGLQQTNYPIGYEHQKEVLLNYYRLFNGEDYQFPSGYFRIRPEDFIGPSSYTLQIENVVEETSSSNIPNIRKNYTVTDKADGERKMLYIANNGKIYMIDGNMNVQFTGMSTMYEDIRNTLIDGEHILFDKNGRYINLYAAFDIYFIDNKDVRPLAFIPTSVENLTETTTKLFGKGSPKNFRIAILNDVIKGKKDRFISAIEKGGKNLMRIEVKTFKSVSTSDDVDRNIFDCCREILERVNDNLFEYNTDGLIFTPSDKGVGSNTVGEPAKNYRITWDYSFKWKPPQYNTIDFLITTKKDQSGMDEISNIFEDGVDVYNPEQLTQYKTLILRVGFSESKHGYLNPCNNIYEDKLPTVGDVDDARDYNPVPFYPTNPYDFDAYLCNIILKADDMGVKNMLTKENEIIEDNMIVEFAYDKENPVKEMRWVPLRVRYDKTAAYRSGQKNYGNAYHVANSNWHSIHYPVTDEMITTGKNIPIDFGDDEVYYNRISGESKTKGLRDFHNLYVKKLLITSVARRGNTLIDYAVGQAGDISKWIAANLSFVFGIDISQDNIENKQKGACARYLNYRKKYEEMPSALFVQGNATSNIKNTSALFTEKGKQITRAIFGSGQKDKRVLGEGVYKQYGVGMDGFDISSIQFALHYMLESNEKLHNLLRNLSECTKVGGYFISTAYDGETVFKLLENSRKGEGISIYRKDIKIWEIIKMYDQNTFPDDISSIGYGIDVYQETINKVFREYLINFKYLSRLLENYGFVLITDTEAREFGLPRATGMFSEMFRAMEYEIDRERDKLDMYGEAPYMSDKEKTISFLNRYSVYKKVRNVDAEQVMKISLGLSEEKTSIALEIPPITIEQQEQYLSKPEYAEQPVVDAEIEQQEQPKKIVKKRGPKKKEEQTEIEKPAAEPVKKTRKLKSRFKIAEEN
jgi:hypothetical protein